MATTITEIHAATGQTLTLRLYPDDGSDAIANGAGGDSLTEYANAAGLYSADVTQALVGVYYYRVNTGAGAMIQNGWIYLEDDTSRYRPSDSYETASKLAQLSFTGGRLDSVLEDADGVSDLLFRTAMLAFAVGPNTVTEVSPTERQIEFKKQDGTTVVVTVSYDPVDGQRVGTPTITP